MLKKRCRSMSPNASSSSGRVCADLPQHQLAVGDPPGEVTALAVGGGCGDRTRRRTARRRPTNQAASADPAGHRGCRVGHEQVAEAPVEQRAEQTGAVERGVDVPVTGRAPLQVGVGRPADRGQVGREQLGFAVLQEVQRQPGAPARSPGRRRALQGVGGGAEAVHEDHRQRDVRYSRAAPAPARR